MTNAPQIETGTDTATGSLERLPPQRIYVKHIAFELLTASACAPASGIGAEQIQTRFNLRNRSGRVSEHVYEVVLELSVTGMRDGHAAYRAVVFQAGVFDLADSNVDDTRRKLNTHCASVLFQPAQQAAGEMVAAGGFPPFQLPPVDFDAAYAAQQRASEDAGALQALQQFWKALTHLQTVSGASNRTTNFHPIHGEALAVAQRSREVLPAADQVLAQARNQPETLEMLGTVYAMNNAQHRAVDVYRCMASATPNDPHARYKLATALMYTGDLSGAAREAEACLERDPTFWEAYTVLSTVLPQVSRQVAPRQRVQELLGLLKRYGDQSRARERLNMALAVEFENLGDHARAFEHMVEGNAAGRARRHYGIRQDEALFDAVMRHAPAAQPVGSGYATDEPIFVFGMPRSGTTLVERILSSHPDVKSAGELKQFGMLLKYMSGSPTADLLDVDTVVRCRSLDWKALGERYLASTRPLSGQSPRFIDKFPHHFLYAAYIANALPRARIICVRRNPMDTCLGNFRQVFSELSPFHRYAFDLLDIGRYYVMFDRLMAHWQRVFPGRILEVAYESLVRDQETRTRAMLDFCGLPWDPACLAFEENRAPAVTASAAQVRSPIYDSAIERWKHYAAQLAPLRNLLVEAGIAVRLR
ncbi:MAG: protein-export chaperone SecB [Rhodanobacteraceae bacterium]